MPSDVNESPVVYRVPDARSSKEGKDAKAAADNMRLHPVAMAVVWVLIWFIVCSLWLTSLRGALGSLAAPNRYPPALYVTAGLNLHKEMSAG